MDRLFVGRECAGVDDAHRILLADDLAVSRNHLEIRVDPERLAGRGGRHLQQRSQGQRHPNRARRAVSASTAATASRSAATSSSSERLGDDARPDERPGTGQRSPIATPMTMAMIGGRPHQLLDRLGTGRSRDPRPRRPRLYHEAPGAARPAQGHAGRLRRGRLLRQLGARRRSQRPRRTRSNSHSPRTTVVAKCTADLELRYADGSPLRMGWGARWARWSCSSCPAPSSWSWATPSTSGSGSRASPDARAVRTILATENVRQPPTDHSHSANPRRSRQGPGRHRDDLRRLRRLNSTVFP